MSTREQPQRGGRPSGHQTNTHEGVMQQLQEQGINNLDDLVRRGVEAARGSGGEGEIGSDAERTFIYSQFVYKEIT
jgi:hypothetical protein